MALKDWGPLTSAKKQSEIAAAFAAVKDSCTLDSLDQVKQKVFDWLKQKYKLNQAKFSTWQRFWSQANYEKHVIYLQSLVDAEIEARAVTVSTAGGGSSKSSGSKSGAGNSGNGYDSGSDVAGSGIPTWLIVAVVGVVVVLLIKKFRKK